MEYASQINIHDIDNGYMKHVGYSSSDCDTNGFFDKSIINYISSTVTKALDGVDPTGKSIIVPDKTIHSVMNDVYYTYRPRTGDIYSRHIIKPDPNDTGEHTMINEVIEIITSDVRNNIGIQENNKQLSIWTTMLGDFNEHGLRSHPKIKIRKKRPRTMQFNMNY